MMVGVQILTRCANAIQADYTRLRSTFSQPFHRASATIASRFFTPFYQVFERLLPYGAQLRRDLAYLHAFSRQLVRESLDEIKEEELGTREVKVGRGLIVRGLVEAQVEMSEDELADSCLNFLTAGMSFFSCMRLGKRGLYGGWPVQTS
jgi:hypothetical protein